MHDEACSTPTQGVLPGFKVIDCGTKSVIEAPEKCSYIALSYVWGGGQGSGQAHVEGIFPATIDDSIMVALALGFKYLWVDRYCIDQTSSSEKHAQISGMHKIYSEAALTIIAAAGKDPSYGLPGVGATPRAAQYRVQLGNKTLVEMFPHTNVTLQESEWVSRAWTYQEGFLSKRKLIFDDHQVSFVCGKVFCAESFTHSIEHRALNEELTFGPYFPYDIAFRGTDWKPEGIANCIEEYTERNLSYDSDGLNACLGILNFF
ncbi:HET-domain-containing protein, partial [Trematosphaeria pertusa]